MAGGRRAAPVVERGDGVRSAELCAGYSGLHLGMRLAGWPVDLAWVSETDPDASKVLAVRHPEALNVGDLTAADWAAVEPVDVLAGGIPCQGWSLAGKRSGSDDERDLWPARKLDENGQPRRGALDAIRVLRPRVFVLENVASLVSAEGGMPWGTILADLAELGYATAWVTVGACRVGACHHRHRVFLVAVLGGQVAPPEGSLFGVPVSAVGKWPTAGLVAGGMLWPLPVEVCGAVDTVFPTPMARVANGRGTPSPETAADRMASGRRNLEDAVALLPTPRVSAQRTSRGAILSADSRSAPSLERALEIAKGVLPRELESWDEAPPSWRPLPTPTARDATRGAGWGDQSGRPLSEVIAFLPTPRASDGEKGDPNQRGSAGDLALPAAVQPGRFGVYEAAVRRHEASLGLPAPEPTEPGRLGKPRLSAVFPEWMMALPRGWVTDLAALPKDDPNRITRNAAIRMAGNGAMPQQVALALALLGRYLPVVEAAAVAA